jgi:micrococcal nuclease
MKGCWRQLGCAALLIGLLLTCACSEAASKGTSGVVEWVYDGDTLQVKGIGKVRLIGIDTPEREDSPRDQSFTRLGARQRQLRPIGQAALRFNIAQAKGKSVRLDFDGPRKDRHDRTLAYVYLPDGRLLNRLLLEQGYAVVYRRFDFQHRDDFLRAEAVAREARLGLWGD